MNTARIIWSSRQSIAFIRFKYIHNVAAVENKFPPPFQFLGCFYEQPYIFAPFAAYHLEGHLFSKIFSSKSERSSQLNIRGRVGFCPFSSATTWGRKKFLQLFWKNFRPNSKKVSNVIVRGIKLAFSMATYWEDFLCEVVFCLLSLPTN